MISKELLNEVLEEEVLSVRPYISDDPFYKNVIMWECRKNTYDTINIYELAHKCKEWAYKRGFIIDTGFHKHYINQIKANCYGWVSSNIDTQQNFNACTEPEAIIKACEWILENKES